MTRHPRTLVAILLFVALPLFAQTPEQRWEGLRTDNHEQFAEQESLTLDIADKMPGGQRPRVSILSCADSRVPPELVFAQSIGDLFIVRTAGNIAGTYDLASLEYAIHSKWTQLIIVLGHEDCGAVKEALKVANPGTPALDALVNRIRESFVGLSRRDLRSATEANARYSAASLVANSAMIREAANRTENPVLIIPAYYSMTTGKVERLRP